MKDELPSLHTLSTGVLLQNLAREPGETGEQMRSFLASGGKSEYPTSVGAYFSLIDGSELMQDDQITEILFGAFNDVRDQVGRDTLTRSVLFLSLTIELAVRWVSKDGKTGPHS